MGRSTDRWKNSDDYRILSYGKPISNDLSAQTICPSWGKGANKLCTVSTAAHKIYKNYYKCISKLLNMCSNVNKTIVTIANKTL